MKTTAIVFAAVALLLITEATVPEPDERIILPKLVLSPDLAEALNKAQNSLGSTIKAPRRTLMHLEHTELPMEDMFIETDDGISIYLSNVKLISVPSIDIKSSDPNLEFLNMAVDIEVGPLEVVGHFHMLSSETLVENLNETSGELTLKYASVKVTGKVGLSLEKNVFSTINYDVVYHPSGTNFTVSYPENNNGIDRVLDVPDQQEAKIVENINRELKYVLSRRVKQRLDDVLKEIPLEQLIEETQNIVSYRKHASALAAITNEFMEEILSKANSYINENGLSQVSVPDIDKSFSKTIMWVTWHGSFRTTDGKAGNLDTLIRKGDISSYYVNDETLELFGNVGLPYAKLGCKYRAEFMGSGPSGTLSATAGSNSIFLKVKISKLTSPAVTLEDVRTEYIKDIEVDATGLGVLSWLLSKILTWVADLMNKDIKELIEGQLQKYLPEILKLVDPEGFFR